MGMGGGGGKIISGGGGGGANGGSDGGSPPSGSAGFRALGGLCRRHWNSDRMIWGEREHGDAQRSENDELLHS